MQDPWVGHRLGNYELAEAIGQGGMATVYRAVHVALGTEHAVKVLAPEYARHPDVKARFLREGRVQARFAHPGIARVTDTVSEPAVALVMDLLRGESLRDVIERGPIAPEAAALIVEDVADALAYAHARGVIHRDIKPDNIFLADEPDGSVRPMILDFGVARDQALSTLTRSGALLGTPQYMSPEQVDDPRGVDGRADVFSLGVVLFEMLTGSPPHPGDTPGAVAVAVMMGRYRRVSDTLPALAALDDVLDRALTPDPARRHGTVEGFARAVLDALSDVDDVALETDPPTLGPALQSPGPLGPEVVRGSGPRAPTWPPIPEDEVRAIRDARRVGAALRPCLACGASIPEGRDRCVRCGADAPA